MVKCEGDIILLFIMQKNIEPEGFMRTFFKLLGTGRSRVLTVLTFAAGCNHKKRCIVAVVAPCDDDHSLTANQI